MKIVVTIARIDPKYGGPAQTVPALCSALSSTGTAVHLITLSGRGELVDGSEDCGYAKTVLQSRGSRFRSLASREAFHKALVGAVSCDDSVVIYDIGLWLPSNHLVAQFARRRGIPLVVSPRGMLSPAALKVSRWKKRIAWSLYQKRDLRHAVAHHASSINEAADIRACGLCVPIAAVPNGVIVPSDRPDVNVSSTQNASSAKDFCGPDPSSHKGRRTILFLGRLHPIKGLKDLVRAWGQVRPAGWRVVVAGPDEGGHKADVEALITSLGVKKDFEFVGPISGDAKLSFYRSASLFVLPSYSESFGQVVAEALSAGLPVITTQATPWQEIEYHQCGWWIPNGVDALTKTLLEATSGDPFRLRDMGKRGREFVASRYSWDAVARQMNALFVWASKSGPAPSFLRS